MDSRLKVLGKSVQREPSDGGRGRHSIAHAPATITQKNENWFEPPDTVVLRKAAGYKANPDLNALKLKVL